MSRKSKVTALIAAAVAAAALGVAWPLVGLASSGQTAATLASNTFTDTSGDSGDGPDITTVQVSDDSSGKISFAATIANRTVLGDVDAVQAFFDTDKNSGTGGNGGFEYEVAWITNHQELDKWDGSQFATVSPAPKSFSASFKNGQATFSIDKADFGGSATFNLIATTTGDTGDSTADRAPNGSAVWTYPSSSNPPPPPPPPPGSPPPPPPPPGGVTLIVTGFSVGKPHSGKPFTVAEVVRVKQTGVAVKTKVTCSAKLAGKTIKPTKQGSVFSGRASCTWKLPKNTKGKSLKGSITAAYQGAKIKKTFSKTVLP
jgi:hypothetical protein